MNNGRLSFFVLIGIAALAACTQEETVSIDPLGSESVATVDGVPIQTALLTITHVDACKRTRMN